VGALLHAREQTFNAVAVLKITKAIFNPCDCQFEGGGIYPAILRESMASALCRDRNFNILSPGCDQINENIFR